MASSPAVASFHTEIHQCEVISLWNVNVTAACVETVGWYTSVHGSWSARWICQLCRRVFSQNWHLRVWSGIVGGTVTLCRPCQWLVHCLLLTTSQASCCSVYFFWVWEENQLESRRQIMMAVTWRYIASICCWIIAVSDNLTAAISSQHSHVCGCWWWWWWWWWWWSQNWSEIIIIIVCAFVKLKWSKFV